MAFWAKHVHAPMQGRSQIVSSVCGQLCSLFDVKLALLLVLLGGVSTMNSGTRTRGEPHMLLVGDPGTGKSQIIKYAAKLVPRCVVNFIWRLLWCLRSCVRSLEHRRNIALGRLGQRVSKVQCNCTLHCTCCCSAAIQVYARHATMHATNERVHSML
jgi:hypothetical protein